LIATALKYVTGFLNKEIKLQYGLDSNPVLLSSLINPDGTVTENIENKLILSLINIEHETTVNTTQQFHATGNNSFNRKAPPVCLNLYLLASANYDSKNYTEALKMISTLIGIFQANPYLNKENDPDMPVSIDLLRFEIFNLPIKELSHIWSGIGAKYVPSIIYKVRMLTIQEGQITEQIPGVGGVGGAANT
tara:strand:+ start:1821 stop:2396 length:576 start_codon:yes stop_codon:yes gene_type:complete